MKSPWLTSFSANTLPLLALFLAVSFSFPATAEPIPPSDLTPTPKVLKADSKASGNFSLPKGWIKAGSHPNEYDMGIDETVKRNGSKCASIKSVSEKLHGFGTLMQMFDAGSFKGKRYRLTAWTKCSNVDGWAGLWMRVDGPNPKKCLAFYNMQDRPLKGTSDWTRQEVVLDVPKEATNIAFGVLLNGAGQVWMDDFKFEKVGKNVPTNALKETSCINKSPTNLDFQEKE